MSNIPNWKIMSEISDEDEQCEFIKTGIKGIDSNIQGLILGATSIWSGSNGSNKSGMIAQIALNVINSGKGKVAIFSGELPDKRFKRWLYIQASGKDNNVRKTNERGEEIDFFETPQSIKDRITNWLDGKLYLYDNKAGFEANDIGNAIRELLKYDSEIKLVFIDNLFVLNLKTDGQKDKYEAQKELLLKMTRNAQHYKVHIGFVCHPRKSAGFLRKDDISGTSDITNCADNVFILHRNSTEFKTKSSEYFKWGENNPIYGFDNIVEIAKDRENGAVERFIGLYFEKESKRVLNYKGENIHYGWEEYPKQGKLETFDDNGYNPFDDEDIGIPFD